LTEVVTAVEALFEKGGQIEPRRFTWQETWLDVEGLGRRWIDGGEPPRDANQGTDEVASATGRAPWSGSGTKGETCAAIEQNGVWNALLTGAFSTRRG